MLAADAAVVSKIAELVNNQAKEIKLSNDLCHDGREHHFTTQHLTEIVPAPPPLLAQVKVSTLQGFADLIACKVEQLTEPDRDDYVIHVEDFANVKLIAKDTDSYGRRLALIHATPVAFDRFQFGQWMKQDDFVIKVYSLFAVGGDRDYVIKVAGALTQAEGSVSEVDAFTQRVTVKAGMSLPEEIEIKPSVNLAPYRIFPECQQPFSNFIFRAKTSDGAMPQLMLAEADGGRWKIDAINEVRRFLATLNTGVEIVA